MLDEDEYEDLDSPGPGKFVRAGIVAILQMLAALFFAWLWWQGQENSPVNQVQKMLDEQSKK